MKLLLLSLACAACGASNTSVKDTGSVSTGDTIIVKVNEFFEVKLGAVMASGYSWSIADSNYTSFAKLDTTFAILNSDREGDPETQVFRFKAINKGETVLHFIHVRPWRKTDPPTKEKKYKLTIQ
jgi:predicted secreted protein